MRADPVPPSLTSDPDRFSDDAWELLLAAQDTARRWRHGAMDVEHLLQALLLERRFGRWLDRLPLDPDRLLDRLESFCADQPGGSGSELYIGDALDDLLEDADRCRAAWGAGLLEVPRLEERSNLLATITQIAPLLGLLGTVLGFINIFGELQSAGPFAHAGTMAGGIWQALVCTAAGLALAIPCYAGYNYLVNRVNSIVLDMEKSATDILNLVTGEPHA